MQSVALVVHVISLILVLVGAAVAVVWRRHAIRAIAGWYLPVAGSIFFFAVLSSLSLKVLVERHETVKGALESAASSPGVLLYILLGLITIVGFGVTINQLHDERVRIPTYRRLLGCCGTLLADAWKNGHEVYFIGNTPLLGSMSHSRTSLYADFRSHLQGLAGRSLLRQIVCLSWQYPRQVEQLEIDGATSLLRDEAKKMLQEGGALGRFYESFTTRGHTYPECARGFLESVFLLQKVAAYGGVTPVDQMMALPGYHLLLSRASVVVAIPLTLPRIAGAPGERGDEPSRRDDDHSVPVQMIGEMSYERNTVSRFEEIHADLLEACSPQPNEEGG